VWVPWCWFGNSGFFGKWAAVGHGMVVVGLARKGGGTATTTTAKVEETKAQSEEENERNYNCCCDFAAGWSGVVASICRLQRAVWIV
jgi:hypothetical protein